VGWLPPLLSGTGGEGVPHSEMGEGVLIWS